MSFYLQYFPTKPARTLGVLLHTRCSTRKISTSASQAASSQPQVKKNGRQHGLERGFEITRDRSEITTSRGIKYLWVPKRRTLDSEPMEAFLRRHSAEIRLLANGKVRDFACEFVYE
eukprot:638344-Amorphochlora_amoeboformis.AAC.1